MNIQTQFFTLWVFVLICLAPITTNYVNVFFLSTIVLLVGSYFSFVEPGFYTLDNGKVVSGWIRFWFVDVCMHLLPWLFLLWFHRCQFPPIQQHWRGTMLVVVAYLMVYPPWEINVYDVSLSKLAILLSLAVLLYHTLASLPVLSMSEVSSVVSEVEKAVGEP